jgi:hypothetical protein
VLAISRYLWRQRFQPAVSTCSNAAIEPAVLVSFDPILNAMTTRTVCVRYFIPQPMRFT